MERLTGCYLTIRIQGKTTQGASDVMQQLYHEFGSRFSQVFRALTTDNGSEFASFSEMEAYAGILCASIFRWERPANERSNRILRRFMPKGKSMNNYTDDQVLMFSNEISAMPRKRLNYRTPEELFEERFDQIYRL